MKSLLPLPVEHIASVRQRLDASVLDEMNEISAARLEQKNEITNCLHDSSYFINKFLRVEGVCGPEGVILDTPKEELLEVMEHEQLLIARYPRMYGKTTLLVGFALHQILFLGNTVVYSTLNNARRIDFMKQVAYSYRNLPTWMQTAHTEGPEKFEAGNGKLFQFPLDANKLFGKSFNHMIFDDTGRQEFRILDFMHLAKGNNAKLSIVGTFESDHPILGKIWSEARTPSKTGWVSLPSFNEEWKVETILSLSHSMYAQGY